MSDCPLGQAIPFGVALGWADRVVECGERALGLSEVWCEIRGPCVSFSV